MRCTHRGSGTISRPRRSSTIIISTVRTCLPTATISDRYSDELPAFPPEMAAARPDPVPWRPRRSCLVPVRPDTRTVSLEIGQDIDCIRYPLWDPRVHGQRVFCPRGPVRERRL